MQRVWVRAVGAILVVPVVAGCSGVRQPVAGPLPTATVTVTASAEPTAAEETREREAAERDTAIGQQVAGLIASSAEGRVPVEARFLALIRRASFDPGARADRALTLNIDKVTWNDDYTDGGDEEPILNPRVSWETVRLPEVVVLSVPEAAARVMTTEEFVRYVNAYGEGQDPDDVFRLPFTFYYAGEDPVAIVERYVP